MSPTRTVILGAIVTALASACSEAPGPDPTPPALVEVAPSQSTDSAQIPWFDGDVEEAFEAARASGKPVYLYWSAQWCPYCAQVQATIFKRREFIERSSLFVPVYLDGDTEQAQAQGDRFGVLGYPTMIVLAPDGTEITRIAGGLDIGLYARVLDSALSAARPVRALVESVVSGTSELGEADYRLLAYYSWEQDNDRALAGFDNVTALRAMADACPPGLEQEASRLYANYVTAAVAAQADAEQPMSAAQKSAARERIAIIVASPKLYRANMALMLYDSAAVVEGLTDPDSDERRSLVATWNETLDVIGADPAVSITERVRAALSKLRLTRLLTPEQTIPAELAAEVRERVAWADAAATDPYERQTVVNTAWYLLHEIGFEEEASAMLMAELERSKTPYYFMLDLADLAQKAGRTEEAIGWFKRAHDDAVGPATRFQWGVNYLIGLMEMVPEQALRIEEESLRVFDELGHNADPFSGRYRRYLERLARQYARWNEAGTHAGSLEQIRARLTPVCAANDDAQARSSCGEFIEGI